MAQFLVMVRVAELEPHVTRLRNQFDPSARRGLAAHITLLHSSMPAEGMAAMAIGRIGAAVSSMAPFDYRITRVARFPGTLYLAAEPAEPFVSLKGRLTAALPMDEPGDCGQERLIPHVSVVRKSTLDDSAVEAELTTMLERYGPIPCLCHRIELLENSSGLWRPVEDFVLGVATDRPASGNP